MTFVISATVGHFQFHSETGLALRDSSIHIKKFQCSIEDLERELRKTIKIFLKSAKKEFIQATYESVRSCVILSHSLMKISDE